MSNTVVCSLSLAKFPEFSFQYKPLDLVFVLYAGYESLLEAVRVAELSLLYGFFSRFKDGLPLMSKAFSDYIKV